MNKVGTNLMEDVDLQDLRPQRDLIIDRFSTWKFI